MATEVQTERAFQRIQEKMRGLGVECTGGRGRLEFRFPDGTILAIQEKSGASPSSEWDTWVEVHVSGAGLIRMG